MEEDGWASNWRLSEGVKECAISIVFFPGVSIECVYIYIYI